MSQVVDDFLWWTSATATTSGLSDGAGSTHTKVAAKRSTSEARDTELATAPPAVEVGAAVRKKFPGFGEWDGKVESVVDGDTYTVRYSDGSIEVMSYDKLRKILVTDKVGSVSIWSLIAVTFSLVHGLTPYHRCIFV